MKREERRNSSCKDQTGVFYYLVVSHTLLHSGRGEVLPCVSTVIVVRRSRVWGREVTEEVSTRKPLEELSGESNVPVEINRDLQWTVGRYL